MPMLNFFDAGSPYLSHPLLTAVRTNREVEFIISKMELAAGMKVLDVGCGFGRHSVRLAQRGYEVMGIDPSATMIEAACNLASTSNVVVDFRQVAGEKFRTNRQFDAAICLFTTLGQLTNSGENSGLVAQVYQALKPDGLFLVEVPQRETAVRQLKTSEKFGSGDRFTTVTRHYDPDCKTIQEQFELVSPEKTEMYYLSYRLYSRDELFSLLQKSGFTVQASYGNYEGEALGDHHTTMISLSKKICTG